MLLIILSLFVLLNVMIGFYDFSFYRIPNLLLGLLLMLYGFYAPLYLDFNTIASSLIIFAVVFVFSFALYALKAIGAGDAKYLAVVALWFGVHGIIPLLFFVSLAGGMLALVYVLLGTPIARLSDWVWSKIQKAEVSCPRLEGLWLGSGKGPEKGTRENIGSRMIPYGIAIAAGSIITLIINPITHL